MQYPVIERLVILHAAQSTSQKAFNTSGADAEKNSPMSYVDFKYLTMYRAANQCGFVGLCMNWLKWWTTNITSGRVKFKYKRRPISLGNCEGSSNNSPSFYWSCKPCGKGVGANVSDVLPLIHIYACWRSSYLKSQKIFGLSKVFYCKNSVQGLFKLLYHGFWRSKK